MSGTADIPITLTRELPPEPPMRQALLIAMAIGGAGAAAVAVGWGVYGFGHNGNWFYRAYLHSWLIWLGVSLGSMALVMIHHLSGGEWGVVTRPVAEAAAATMPLHIILFVPIAIGVGFGYLYPWAKANLHDQVLVHRQPYLNPTFYLGRAALYGIIWCALALYFYFRSRATSRRVVVISGIGLALWALTMSLPASTDWILSLEPRYSSTVFGWIVVAGQGISAICVIIISLALLSRYRMFRNVLTEDHFNDLGNILLTVVLLHAYLVASQLVINWMGNTQDDARWYVQRLQNGWYWLGWTIVVLHLLLPTALLLLRPIKRNPIAMLWLCCLLLGMRMLYMFWMVSPSGEDPVPLLQNRWTWMDFVFPVGIGGIWAAAFIGLLMRRALVSAGDDVAPGGES